MPTITGIATGNPNFSVLVAALQHLDATLGTDLVNTLDTPGADLTVFAPTNAAFASLAGALGYAGDLGDVDAVSAFLTGNVAPATLLAIVQYHVAPTARTAAEIAEGGPVPTLNGATIAADLPTLVDNEPDLIDPSVIGADTVADNGIVHVIDQVLLPIDLPGNDAPTIAGIVATSGTGFDGDGTDFDLLREAIDTAGLGGVLNDAGQDLTVFAPNDAAFQDLAKTLGYSGSSESGAWSYLVEALTLLGGGDPVPLLSKVLLAHVSGESLQASQVLSSDAIPTLSGLSLGVDGASLVDADPDIANPNIVATDIQAANGVVHVLDGVLLPADLLASNGANDVDFIIAGDKRDVIFTGADNDFVDANGGRDWVFAGSGNDTVLGGNGGDRIFAYSGSDTVNGDDGRDYLNGGGGNDIVSGGKGRDTVLGNRGDDTVSGNNGRDYVNGGSGDDLISGGRGNDTLVGGWGRDTFVFSAGDDRDKIVDFRSGQDKIDLSSYGFSDFGDVKEKMVSNFFGTRIDLGDGDSIFLTGLFGVRLDESDFIL